MKSYRPQHILKILMCFFMSICICCYLLTKHVFPNYRWYITVIVTMLICMIFHRFSIYNYNAKSHYFRFGWANIVTLIRGGCIAIVAGSIFLPLSNFMAICFFVAIVLDLVDGVLARLTKHTSKFGSHVDMECDALAMLVAAMICVSTQLPFFYIFVGLLRYLFVLHLCFRKGFTLELPPSNFRRFIAGLNMLFVSVALFPNAPQSILLPASYVFATVFYVTFLRDWLWVVHQLDYSWYSNFHKIVTKFFFGILPFVCSILLFFDASISPFISSAFFLCSLAYFLQINVRFISLLVIILYCVSIIFFPPQQVAMIMISTIVVSLGSYIRG